MSSRTAKRNIERNSAVSGLIFLRTRTHLPKNGRICREFRSISPEKGKFGLEVIRHAGPREANPI